MNLSTKNTLQMATILKKVLGRSAVEPYLKPKLEMRDRQLDDWFVGVELKHETKDAETMATVVCRSTSGFLKLVNKCSVDPHNHMVKVGLDGGVGILKITCSIIGDDIINNVASSSIDHSSPSAASRDTGVKRLFLLAVAPRAPESYSVMARLMRELRLHEVGGLHFAADLKMANVICGLQNPAGAAHPCPWCTLQRSKFGTDEEGELRTLGSVRRSCERWRAECRKRGRALPAIHHDNCVEEPLLPGDDETLVLDLLPPMELHLLLGAVNRLVDHLEKTLEESDSRLTAKQWVGRLGLSRCSYNGGNFDGNSCNKLLGGGDILQSLAEAAGAHCVMPVVAALRTLRAVVHGCFGCRLEDDVADKVATYRDAFLQLGIPVTTKNHAIFSHVVPFCRTRGRGLGLFSEQANESVHSDFKPTWSCYKVGPQYDSHPKQLLRAMLAYNCRHL